MSSAAVMIGALKVKTDSYSVIKSNFIVFISASFVNKFNWSKKKSSYRSKFLPLRVDLILASLFHLGKQLKVTKVVPSCKKGSKMEVLPCTKISCALH